MIVETSVPASTGPSEVQENNPNQSSGHRSACPGASPILEGLVRIVATLAVSTGFAAVAGSAFADDVAHGAQLAQQWCMGCHVLPDHPKQTALQGPPSFRGIAHSGKTSDQLRVFLLKPHGAMPPLTLSRPEIDDLIGYIETLR